MLTIPYLLQSIEFRNNQSHLAIALNVNRGTLRKFLDDHEGMYHEVRMFKGKLQLMTLNTLGKRAYKTPGLVNIIGESDLMADEIENNGLT